MRRGKAEGDPGSCRRGVVAGLRGLVEDGLELGLGRCDVGREAKLELGVGNPQLALVRIAEVTTRLEVLDGDAELPSQHSESLDRRRPRAGLDAGDVCVRDAWSRELALGQASLEAQALQAHADRFHPHLLGGRHHGV